MDRECAHNAIAEFLVDDRFDGMPIHYHTLVEPINDWNAVNILVNIQFVRLPGSAGIPPPRPLLGHQCAPISSLIACSSTSSAFANPY